MATKFTRFNQPVDCRCCGKRTVSDLDDAAEDMCRVCSNDGLQENHHSDGACEGRHYQYDEPCRFCDTNDTRSCAHEEVN